MRIILAFLTIIVLGCKDGKKPNLSESNVETKEVAFTIPSGKKIMETQCFVCHGASMSEKDRIAPPMVAIKARYIDSTTTKEEFANSLWDFVKSPSEEKVKLKGAFKRFGVMPYQQFSEEDIKSISEYMYEYQIDQPEWFKAHWEKKHGNGNFIQTGKKLNVDRNLQKTYSEIGLEYALSTKKVLGKNLMGTIQKKGTVAALEFCNLKANKLTDSMATVHSSQIRRVTDKTRNPNNQANAKELSYIEQYKKTIAAGEKIEPIVDEQDATVNFYYPITTNKMCLQCHGKPNKNIKPEVLTSLFQLYPEDKAKGYNINEVRGIWSISFKK